MNGAVVFSHHLRQAGSSVLLVASDASAQTTPPLPVRLPGLDPDRRYRVGLDEVTLAPHGAYLGPAGIESGPVELPGSVLSAVGLTLPVILPESARLIRVTTADG